jgi:adenosylcobinamide-phosphate synthase
MEVFIILAGALALDLLLGEPPLVLHPVVWMGKIIMLWEKGGWFKSPIAQFIYGAFFTLFTIGLFAAPAYFLLHFLKGWNLFAFIIVGALIFKTTFSFRELRQAALKIKVLLLKKDLESARFNLRALVKRQAHDLPEPLIVSAVAESMAENISDSFVAPLLYFLVLGIPGAIAYRVINTLDAMIGMHGKYEYLGKFAARLDDLVNIVPSRLTALLIVLAAFLMRSRGRQAWRILLRDHSRTESPNAGYPMSAAAGALGVQFTKTGHYQLGDARQPMQPQTVDKALKLIDVSAFFWVIICFIAEVVCFVIASQT